MLGRLWIQGMGILLGSGWMSPMAIAMASLKESSILKLVTNMLFLYDPMDLKLGIFLSWTLMIKYENLFLEIPSLREHVLLQNNSYHGITIKYEIIPLLHPTNKPKKKPRHINNPKNKKNNKKMQSLETLLTSTPILYYDNLIKSHNPPATAITKQFIAYGMAHQDHVVCLLSARKKDTGEYVTGCFVFRDVLGILADCGMIVDQMMPYAVFTNGYTIQQVIQQAQPELNQKIGNILTHKVRPTHTKKQPTQTLTKKSSQTSTKANEKPNQKQLKQKQPTAKPQLHLHQPNKAPTQKKQSTEPALPKNAPKQPKTIQMQNQYPPIKPPTSTPTLTLTPATTTYKNSKLQVQSDSEDEEKILSKFNIEVEVKQNQEDKQKEKMVTVVEDKMEDKVEEMGNVKKVEDLKCSQDRVTDEFDLQDAFEAMLKKRKQSKPQNKNLNILDKALNKTADKPQKPAIKPQQNDAKIVGQASIFSFMKKK